MGDWDDLLEAERAGTVVPGYEKGRLAREWVVPPFTVLDTTQGYWRERRHRWLSLGIESELGRGGMTAQRMGQWEGREADGDGFNPGTAVDATRSRHTGARKGALDRVVSIIDAGYAGGAWDQHPSYKRRAGARRGALDLSDRILDKEVTGTNMGRHASHQVSREAWRRQADERSNVTGAAELPDYADGFGMANVAPGTSIFDPVLCECSYRWWCPPGGTILDPFAGGSVRGIVAAMLGHAYTGIDLSHDQVEANRAQAARILPAGKPVPTWIVGDSREAIAALPAGTTYDMVYTCPPYYDLEVYSDDPRDLSVMGTYREFVDAYADILAAAVARLRPNRFAAVVVSDVRGKDGTYVGLSRDTELLMERAGARKYNEAVLVNAVGTLAMRTMNQMIRSRKLGRQHQEVLVFAKGTIDTRQWVGVREAPPDPQLDMGMDDEPAAPVQVPLLAVPSDLLDEPDGGAHPPPGLVLGGGPVDAPTAATAASPGATLALAPADPPVALPDEHPEPTRLEVPIPAPAPAHRPLQPVPGPPPPPDMLEVRPVATVERDHCQQCGLPDPGPDHEHPPWVSPDHARALMDAGIWKAEDATPEDAEAMGQEGLWP